MDFFLGVQLHFTIDLIFLFWEWQPPLRVSLPEKFFIEHYRRTKQKKQSIRTAFFNYTHIKSISQPSEKSRGGAFSLAIYHFPI